MNIFVRPVDPHIAVLLPKPWPELIASNFHPDLVLRAQGMMHWANREGCTQYAKYFLSWVGQGFIEPWQYEKFVPLPNDPDHDLKIKALDALASCTDFYGDRVSSVVWDSFACLFTRPNPQVAGMIREFNQYMVHPWFMIDTVLHASGLVYNFMLHLQSELNTRTGMVFDHNCDCSHVIQAPPMGAVVRYFSPKDKIKEASAALFSHLFCLGKTICVDQLPFALGITEEWKEHTLLI